MPQPDPDNSCLALAGMLHPILDISNFNLVLSVTGEQKKF